MGIAFDLMFYDQVVAPLLQSFKVWNDTADA